MAMTNPQEEEKKFELGTATKKRLSEMRGKQDHIGLGDLNARRAEGASQEELQQEYNQAKEAGDRVGIRAQARMNDFTQAQTLDDFNPDEISVRNAGKQGGNDVNRAEMASLLGMGNLVGDGIKNHGVGGVGFKASEVNDMIKSKGYTLSSGAQKMLNKRLAALGSETPTDVTDPGDGTPVVDTKPPMQVEPELERLPVSDVADLIQGQSPIQGQGANRLNNNKIETSVGDGNTFNGNFNSGIIDQSINLQGQTTASNRVGGETSDGGVVSQNGAMSMGGRGADNFASAATTMGLLENIYNRSNTNFNPYAEAQRAITASENQIGATERIANLDYLTRLDPMYNEMKAAQVENRYLGDLDATKTPDWVQTANPEKYETDFDEIANKYKL